MGEVTPEQIEAMLPAVRPTARRLLWIIGAALVVLAVLLFDGSLTWYGWAAFVGAWLVALAATAVRVRIWQVFRI